MPKPDLPVTRESIDAAKAAAAAERVAAGITCDSDGRIVHPVRKTA